MSNKKRKKEKNIVSPVTCFLPNTKQWHLKKKKIWGEINCVPQGLAKSYQLMGFILASV